MYNTCNSLLSPFLSCTAMHASLKHVWHLNATALLLCTHSHATANVFHFLRHSWRLVAPSPPRCRRCRTITLRTPLTDALEYAQTHSTSYLLVRTQTHAPTLPHPHPTARRSPSAPRCTPSQRSAPSLAPSASSTRRRGCEGTSRACAPP